MSTIKLTATGGGGGTVSLKAPAATTSNAALELTLPVDDGTSDQYLKTDGSGVLSFGTVSTQDTLSFRNLMINGAMRIAQYGTSSTTASSRVCDRFRVGWGNADEALTYSQHALTSSDTGPWAKGFRYSLHIQNGNQTSGAGADDYATINYRTEAQDLVNSGWDHTSASSYLTLSFWVKSSVAQTFYIIINNNDGTTYNYPVETGALTANTWTKVTKTIPGNSNLTINNDNGKGLEFDIQLFRGTNSTGSVTLNQWATMDNNARTPDNTSTWWTTNDATWEITGVQLEVGSTATEYEHRTYQDDLLRCCRYYQELTGHCQFVGRGAGSDTMDFTVPLIVPLRASPTISKTNSYYRGYDPNSAGNSSNTPTVGTFHANKPYLRCFLNGFTSNSGVEDDKCCTLQQWDDGVTKLSAEL